jgi:hypothetical protein
MRRRKTDPSGGRLIAQCATEKTVYDEAPWRIRRIGQIGQIGQIGRIGQIGQIGRIVS